MCGLFASTDFFPRKHIRGVCVCAYEIPPIFSLMLVCQCLGVALWPGK